MSVLPCLIVLTIIGLCIWWLTRTKVDDGIIPAVLIGTIVGLSFVIPVNNKTETITKFDKSRGESFISIKLSDDRVLTYSDVSTYNNFDKIHAITLTTYYSCWGLPAAQPKYQIEFLEK